MTTLEVGQTWLNYVAVAFLNKFVLICVDYQISKLCLYHVCCLNFERRALNTSEFSCVARVAGGAAVAPHWPVIEHAE